MPVLPILPLLAINAIFMMALMLVAQSFASLDTLAALWPALVHWPHQASNHLALATGILPLILAAMLYFIPVLTRSNRQPPTALRLSPLAAWLAGLLMVLAFSGLLPLTAASHPAFLLAGGCALAILLWSHLCARRTVGQPHPGLLWYQAALLCLLLALLAIPLMSVWPAQRAALRLFHVHLNLLGFVGLTALGTVQVLLPTSLGRPNPAAGLRLSQDIRYALSGALLLALGSALQTLHGAAIVLTLAGSLLYLIAPLRMAWQWWREYRPQPAAEQGAARSLISACLGLLACLLLGFLHARGSLSGLPAITGLMLAFLLPLVSGAASQLLPVWLRPGPQSAWHKQLRLRLGRCALPASSLLLAGGLLHTLELSTGLWLALPGAALLAGNLLLSLLARAPE